MQNNNQSVTPHDDFFKLLMEVRENAAEVIRAGIPERIAKKLDLKSLKSINASFNDPGRGNYYADVLYECKYGKKQKALIALLFEHKSHPEPYPHFQLLLYMAGIWLKQVRNGMTPSAIFPIIFYHGQRNWEYPKFSKYFQSDPNEESEIDEDVKPFLPEFEFIFINLKEKGDDWIRETISIESLKISMLVMRNIRSPKLLDLLPNILKGVEKIKNTKQGRDIFNGLFVYLSRGSQVPDEKINAVMDFATYINRPNPIGSGAWHLEQKTKANVAIKMLKAGFDTEQVAELTELDKKKIEELKNQIS